MAAFPPLVRSSIEEAIARAPALLERALDHAAAALEEAAESGAVFQRRDWRDAAQELRTGRSAWLRDFAPQLRQVLQQDHAPRGPRIHPSTLTLVDDDTVQQSIESSRLAQAIAGTLEQPLAELDAVMSAALGLEAITPEANPLQPERFTTALRNVLATDAAPGRTGLWMRHMARPVGDDLVAIYKAASKSLQRAGVRAAGYRLVTGAAPLMRESQPLPLERESRAAPLEPASRPSPLQGAAPPAPTPSGIGRWLGRALEAMPGPLLRDFLNGTSGPRLPARQLLDSSWDDWVAQELAQLEASEDEAPPLPVQDEQRHAHLPPLERPARVVGTGTALRPEDWGRYAAPRQRSIARSQARRQAREVGQVVGVEVVRQLVEEVARDRRLPAPVREAIVALEPALARMALHAPRFFGQQDHPARQLVEAVAERSLRFNDEWDDGFRGFLAPVRASFNALNGADAADGETLFSQSLQRLRADWSRADEAAVQRQDQVMQAVRFAEQRQAEAGRIAWDLSHRSDLDGAPALVQDFLFGPWALVLAHARLAAPAGQVDPGGYLAAITDLLWSVKPAATLKDPARAFELIPRVMLKLREGLLSVGHPDEETAQFFAGLEQLHRPVLKLRARLRKQALPPPIEPSPELAQRLAPAQPRKPAARADLWLAPREVRALGFEEAPGSVPLAADGAGPQRGEALVDAIAQGAWVDLFAKGRWRRARLVWAGSRRSLFMFASDGGEPHSMSRRSLLRLVQNGHLRLVDAHPVVQRALDALSTAQAQPLAA
ncbi:DUF1631 family protein [Ramlibacter algicola]|uniref:DUF1631 family protein n=1 Tax=Ramlibacter algicola TaxID=2795217 RepID=A0A934PZJ2_9BURK|nr:DUF1631 family protein [Ramlibacter algicola]MBK0391544.1 DUF1631 family protein [Ramlibacter algicola]